MSYRNLVKRFTFAYLTGATTTTITTGGTYVPIGGTFSNDPSESFIGVADPALQYKNHRKMWFEIDWHATISPNSNGMTVHIGAKKNGTMVAPSIMGTYLKTANECQALSGTFLIELDYDDKIQLVVTADGDGDIVDFKHFTTSIIGIIY